MSARGRTVETDVAISILFALSIPFAVLRMQVYNVSIKSRD